MSFTWLMVLMPREKMAGENLRDGTVEVAFEQRTQRQAANVK